MSADALLAVLQVAAESGTVNDALSVTDRRAIRAAHNQDLIFIDGGGFTATADYALDRNLDSESRNDLRLELTDAGREHLAGA